MYFCGQKANKQNKIGMSYKWKFATVGGNTRVVIDSGEDIRHLGELDRKMWTVLSCPTIGLEIPESTLRLIDSDGDGKIRVDEVVAASEWLCSVLRDPEVLIAETDVLRKEDLNPDNADGAQMLAMMERILGDKPELTLGEAEAYVGAIAVEQQPLPAVPFEADNDAIVAAYKAAQPANDAWFRAVHLEKLGLVKTDPEAAPAVKEEEWVEMGAKIAAYEAECAAVNAANAAAIAAARGEYDSLLKLLKLKKSFYTLLKNYVTLQDFYTRDKLAAFQCGTLYIDQRACVLCIPVQEAASMAATASQSSMYLLTCDCINRPTGKTMKIVAAVTVGDVNNLAVGKNALFYDRNGLDYDAKVTAILDNPISIRQAFWSPYKRLAKWAEDLINKRAAEKDAKMMSETTTTLATAEVPAGTDAAADKKAAVPAFDIAKFAGIFAAIGMALGMIGTALVSVFSGLSSLTWWQLLLVFAGLLLFVSGPSMLMAYLKLRRRNLAPILNANGWAVNAQAIISVAFGATLTQEAKYPVIKMKDPFEKKGLSTGAKWGIGVGCVLAAAGIAWLVLWLLGICPCCC